MMEKHPRSDEFSTNYSNEILNVSNVDVTPPSDLDLMVQDPTNHTISWSLTENTGDYLGLYSFTEDSVGSNPNGWTVSEGVNTYCDVIANSDNHRKVVELWDSNSGGIVMMQDSISRVAGTVEFWVRANYISNTQFNLILEQSYSVENINFIIRRNSGTNWIGLYTTYTESFTPDTWYHVRLEFDCTTDKVKYWLNSNYKGEFNFNVPTTSINNVRVQTSGPFAYAGCRVWVDAIDYSWAPGYYLNRNMNQGTTNLTYAVYEDGIQETNWQQWTGSVQIDYNVSGQNLGVGIHNVSLVYNDEYGHWYHDDVTVSVNTTVVADWNVPPDLEIELEVGRDRDCTVSFNFTNNGTATLVNLNFSIAILPTSWSAIPYSQAYSQLDPGETIVVSFLITVGPSDKEFFEQVDINFTATVMETGEPVSDLITVWIAGFKHKNITFWIILVIGSISAVATTSFVIIRKRKAVSTGLEKTRKSKSLKAYISALPSELPGTYSVMTKELKAYISALSSELPGTYSVMTKEIMEKLNEIEDLSADEKELLIQYIIQVDRREALEFLDELREVKSN